MPTEGIALMSTLKMPATILLLATAWLTVGGSALAAEAPAS